MERKQRSSTERIPARLSAIELAPYPLRDLMAELIRVPQLRVQRTDKESTHTDGSLTLLLALRERDEEEAPESRTEESHVVNMARDRAESAKLRQFLHLLRSIYLDISK